MYFEAHAPKRINPKILKKAIEMEFDLPYPEGKLGLVDRALDAFSKGHDTDLHNTDLHRY
jgi:hypothetical protein